MDGALRMKHSKLIGIGCAVLVATLWASPLARALSFSRWAHAYFAETRSINAANDVWFSSSLLASYVVSLLAALLLAWFLFRSSRLVFLLPVGLVAFAVIAVIRLQPESPIHLFPAMRPWRPALISLAAAAFGALLHYGRRF